MKTPDCRQADSGVFGEQLNLIEPPPFSPQLPAQSSLTDKTLKLLLSGRSLTHPQFVRLTGSWRLAAYVRALREMNWPIETHEILCPSQNSPDRVIARYSLPRWVITELEDGRT